MLRVDGAAVQDDEQVDPDSDRRDRVDFRTEFDTGLRNVCVKL